MRDIGTIKIRYDSDDSFRIVATVDINGSVLYDELEGRGDNLHESLTDLAAQIEDIIA